MGSLARVFVMLRQFHVGRQVASHGAWQRSIPRSCPFSMLKPRTLAPMKNHHGEDSPPTHPLILTY